MTDFAARLKPTDPPSCRSTVHFGLGLVLLSLLCGAVAAADDPELVQVYRSDHFAVHTDLPNRAARAMLREMEASLAVMTTYWQRPATARIDCYIVNDPLKWSHASFPNRHALAILGKINGYTESRRIRKGRREMTHSRVYATPDIGVVRHEITHAYHDQVFAGREMPLWYREGMGELMSYYRADDSAVACRPEMVTYLCRSAPRSVAEILSDEELRRPMARSVALACREGVDAASASVDISRLWGPAEEKIFRETREEYCWAWALCHLMYHHPAYQERFRQFGRGFASHSAEQPFADAFAAVSDRLDFELQQFTSNIDVGYRVDLCRWDWQTPFSELPLGQSVECPVEARRGYQATGVLVESDAQYRFTASGSWSMGDAAHAVTADGDRDGAGRLVAVVMKDNALSSTFALGKAGQFVAPQSGKLYVRCQDAWGELADNSGQIALHIVRCD